MRGISRLILFFVTGLVLVIFYVPLGHSDYAGRWGDGTFGIRSAREPVTIVAGVAAGSPAARADVRVGDRVIVPSFSADWPHALNPRAGEVWAFSLEHPDGSHYQVTLRAVAVPGFSWWSRLSGILAIIPATVFLVIAFALVFLRPSAMSWSFYAFAIGYFSTAPAFEYFAGVVPANVYIALTFVLSTFVGGFAVLPLLQFVLRFPDDELRGVRRIIDRSIWVVMGVAFLAYSLEWYQRWAGISTTAYAGILDTWLPLATFFAAALLLIAKFKHAPAEIRQRFAFLAVGLIVSFVAYAIYFVPGVSIPVAQICGYAVIIMPISVAYAVLRHRVLDVTFVLNRAIGYGLVSIVVIAIVSLLDWMFGRIVSERHLAVAGELGATIALGFLLDRINKWTERGVESVLFRGRRVAERYLQRAAEALPYATEVDAVTDGLVQVPDEALKLTAVAHYRRAANGRFDGAGTTRDTAIAPSGFDANHLLVRMLQASEAHLWLDELRTHLDSDNAAIYVLAIPVTVRHELVSFTLYGAHRNGAQLDPEEVKLLEGLAREASRAYDHIEAVQTRQRYAQFIAGAQPETV